MAGMLAHRLSSGGQHLVEALRFPLRLRVVGGEETPSDQFREWAWEGYHRSFMGPWAAVVVSYICLLMRDMQGIYQAITISLMGLTALTLAATSFNLIPFIKREDQHKWARYLIIQFSALQITLTWILAFEGHYVGDSLIRVCTYWLDTFTNLGVTVPNLAMADWSTGEWLLYVLAHISSSAPLFVNWMGYTIPFAVFKVVFIQSLGLFVYMTMERSKFKLFFVQLRREQQQQQERLEKKLAHLEGPSAAGPSSLSARLPQPLSSDSRGEHAPEQPLAGSVPKECQTVDLIERPPYRPVLRGHKVMIKIHGDIGPEELRSSPHCQELCNQITSSFKKCIMVETAARRGCLMLSLHLCELLRLAQQQWPDAMQRSTTELKLAEQLASLTMTWLDAQAQVMNGFQDRLVNGTVVSVQVNNCTFRGVWNSSTQALELAPDAGPPSPILKSLYSITFSEPALLLPPAASVAPAPAAAACAEAEIQGSHVAQLQQQQPTTSKYASSITLDVLFRVPAGSPELVGWQEQAKGEHGGMVDADKLVVLATARGWCLPVEITHQPEWQFVPRMGQSSGAEEEERAVQVCIGLPPDLLTSSHCLRLELVSSNMLLCGRNLLLVDSKHAEIHQEIKDWALSPTTPDQVTAFVDDLAEFLSFQSLVRSNSAISSATEIAGHDGAGGDAVLGGKEAESDEQNGLLGALITEARRPEMDLMMAEVGLELLHHAVSCGMVCLAEHLLGSLMAYPLSLPFGAIACGRLPHLHHSNSVDSSVAAQEPEKEAQKQHLAPGMPAIAAGRTSSWVSSDSTNSAACTDAAFLDGPHSPHRSQSGQTAETLLSCQSLLILALLSYNRHSLATVLEWGRLYGGPRGAWAWEAVDASCGYSAIQIMQRMPPEHELLQLLLSHETSASAAMHAQLLAQQMRESLAKSGSSNSGRKLAEGQVLGAEGRASSSKVASATAAAVAAVAAAEAAPRAARAATATAAAATTAAGAAATAAATAAAAAAAAGTSAAAVPAAAAGAAATAAAATTAAAAANVATAGATATAAAATMAAAAANAAAAAALTAAAAEASPLRTAPHAPIRLLHNALEAVLSLSEWLVEAVLHVCSKLFSSQVKCTK